MRRLDEILAYNRHFLEQKAYEQFQTTKFPDKGLVVLSCMDTRLVELLPKAMNLRNGDFKLIKNAGAIVSHPFGSIMRSILVAIYELKAEEVCVVGHHDCGMSAIDPDRLVAKMKERGVSAQTIRVLEHAGVDLRRWLRGFAQVEEAVKNSVAMIRNHPLLPRDVAVHGLIIDPHTGKLELVENGYDHR
ncbi:beta-class carbonic anhydrase [Brevibacillus marinus]|uniref:beta-class carbonic anhydrase n=1 Tax=Brevibacillus marinus TaxID=2496837 RepID=UPI000F847622|nr:carbonic anhydrase [Brevibacillus marinus]